MPKKTESKPVKKEDLSFTTDEEAAEKLKGPTAKELRLEEKVTATESVEAKGSGAPVRVRLAPSPTGKLHIGTARTGLFNYLFARRHGGTMVLRIEDTDLQRSSDDYVQDILEGLKWLGITWDEGPEVGGSEGPYFQQERLEIYSEYTEQLLGQRLAYKCFCTQEELEQERQKAQDRGEAPKYSGRCRHRSNQELDQFDREGRSFVIRLVVETQTISFDDLVRGQIEFDAGLFGDFVIIRSDETPLFLYSNAIDDHLMKITHVLRGEDHLSNTAKQILITQALKLVSPEYGHFPLILNADRSKMSKRRDPVSVTDDFRALGYLPEALVNFVALLGWSSGGDREIFTLKELTEEFSLETVGKSPAIFDPEKLLWMNGFYIRKLPVAELATRAQDFITDGELKAQTEKDSKFYLKVVALVQDRLKTLSEIESLIDFFYDLPKYESKLLIAKKSDAKRTALALKLAESTLKTLAKWTIAETEKVLRAAAGENKLKDGELLWAVRVALTGRDATPGVFELLNLFGKEESLKRIASARKKLG